VLVPEVLGDLLAEGRRVLGDPQDARLLLLAATGLRHDELIADPGRAVPGLEADVFRAMLVRRRAHEPVSRILGEREFYGRSFEVTAAVLDPRPDTETLVVLALEHLEPGARFLDLGVGSGAIAVTLAAECRGCRGIAVDCSEAALAVAEANARRHGVLDRLTCLKSDWFSAVSGTFDVIVSNPPYIATPAIAGLAEEVKDHDPRLALDGGNDGLSAYRCLSSEAGGYLGANGVILVEIGAGQMDDVGRLFAARGLTLREARRDLAGHVRALMFAAN
jgi:release factor glutamine methyltransferase